MQFSVSFFMRFGSDMHMCGWVEICNKASDRIKKRATNVLSKKEKRVRARGKRDIAQSRICTYFQWKLEHMFKAHVVWGQTPSVSLSLLVSTVHLAYDLFYVPGFVCDFALLGFHSQFHAQFSIALECSVQFHGAQKAYTCCC